MTVIKNHDELYAACRMFEKCAAQYNDDKAEIKRLRQIADERICSSCYERHPVDTMCPPHEVRTTGQKWFRAEIFRLKAALNEAESALWRIVPNTHTVGENPDPFEGPKGETYKDAYERVKVALDEARAENERLRGELDTQESLTKFAESISAPLRIHKLQADLATAKKENERLKAVLDGAGYQNIDNLKNESVEKCRAIGSTAALLTIKAQSDLAACRKELDEARGKVEAYEPIVAAVESHLQRAMLILKGGLEDE